MMPEEGSRESTGRRFLNTVRASGRQAIARCAEEFSVWSDVRAFPALAVWGGVSCVALMLLGRRILAPRSLQLSGLQLAATATVVAVLALVVRGLLSRMETTRPATRIRLFAALMTAWPTLALLVGTSRSVSLASQSWIVAMGLASAAMVWAWNGRIVDQLLVTLFGSPETRRALARSTRPTADDRPSVALMSRAPVQAAPASESKRNDDSRPLFHLERSIRADGTEELRGALRIEFLPGQSQVTAHVAFSPSFARSPAFTCEVVDMPAVRVKGTTIYPYGARIELKAGAGGAGKAPVQIRFRAELPAVRRSA